MPTLKQSVVSDTVQLIVNRNENKAWAVWPTITASAARGNKVDNHFVIFGLFTDMKKSAHQTKVAASIMISIIRLHTNFVTNANIATGLKTLEFWFGKN